MITLLASQPQKNGEPVFDAPWQARSFAMAVKLHEAGVFSWKQWADCLSANIAQFEKVQSIRTSDEYYTLWQQTLEQLTKQLTEQSTQQWVIT